MDCHHCITESAERKKGQHLRMEDRGAIKVLKKQGLGPRAIAKQIGCAPSNVTNELRRGTPARKSNKVLGPWYGMAAAGLGSGLADLLAGYGVYVPATLIIKALVALTAAQCFRLIRANGKLREPAGVLLVQLPAEAVMVIGYYAFETVLLQEPAAAAASVPNNLLQAAIGIVLAAGLYLALSRVPEVRKQLWAN